MSPRAVAPPPSELEGGAQGDDAPPDDRYRVEAAAGPGAADYGELPLAEAARLFRWLRLGPEDVFFDLGSGTGKLVLLAARETAVGRAVGVELSAFRHAAACERLARLGAPAPVELRQEDLRVTDLSDATVIYAGATAFPDPLIGQLAAHVLAAAPRLRALLVLRGLPGEWPARFAVRGRLRVATSWGADEWVWVYGPRGGTVRLP
ncbi:MAG: cyclopropane-fatty-acyl-phospholipid synthase family protein [Planctomycetota bacterium]